MERDSLVSIIIPAYNVEQYIEKCVDSCVHQTYKNIEIIIVNDGSTDNTASICEKIKQKQSNIIYINQNNQGVSSARNNALKVCKGDYCVFLDSDDWLETDTVEKLMKENDKNNVDMVISECFFVEKDAYGKTVRKQQGIGEYDELISAEEALSFVGLRSKYKLQSSCYKLFKISIIRNFSLEFNPEIHFGEDGLFTYCYLCNSETVSYINQPLWNILDRPGSATKASFNPKCISGIDAVNIMLQYRKVNKKIYDNLRALRGERAMWVMINCIRSCEKSEENTRIIKDVRATLRKDAMYLFKRDLKIKLLLQLTVMCCFPIPIVVKMIQG